MGQQLPQLIPLAISVLFGALLGAAAVWLLLRKLAGVARSQVRSENQAEIVRLNERISSVSEDLNQHRARLNESEAKATEVRSQLDVMRDERTRLQERATRVPTLEGQVTEYAAQLSARQEENTRIATQLAERTHAVESLEERLAALEAKHKADLDLLETLRSRLQEETNRSATLAEQSARLPEMEKALSAATAEKQQLNQQVADLRQQLGSAESTLTGQHGRIARLESESSELAAKCEKLVAEQQRLTTQIAELTTTLEAERTQGAEKLALLTEAEQKFSASFESLANKILEEKSQRFTDQNKANIGQILEPLKIKIHEFQSKVEEVYVQEGKDRTALAEQVKQLMGLNQQLSQEANNLTLALKGSSKTQGNWGEMVLERVLEDFGLRKDMDFLMRPTYTKEDGSREQPDAVIHLPENRNLVSDAKVSLVAYDEYTSADNDAARAAAIQRHVASVRKHINALSDANYQSIEELKSLDFVMMFVPIEPAFILAVANDSRLWQDAWQKNILLVSPSSLLFVVRIVANLWRQEIQKRSVQEIFKRGALLYDKFVGFVADLETLGQSLGKAKDSYESAYLKLHTGRGNLIRQAEMLKELGVKPLKTLPSELVEAAIEVPALSATSEDEGAKVQGEV
ncbi:MAG: DNA recombination protein RmuC [Terriglobia bacterium]